MPAPVPPTPHALPVQVAELLRGIGLADVREWVPVWDGAVHAHVVARTPAGRQLAFSLTEPAMYTNPAASGGLRRPLGSLRTAVQLLEAAAFRVRPPRVPSWEPRRLVAQLQSRTWHLYGTEIKT